MTPGVVERCLIALPAAMLVTVACGQIWASRTLGLSPWKGGGFGMFASLDSRPFRYVRIYVSAPERSEELLVAPSLERAAAAAELMPVTGHLDSLARAVVDRERRHGRDVDRVRVEVWVTRFAPQSLAPETVRLREHEHRVAR